MASWEFEITCPEPGPYGGHNVEAEIHGFTFARSAQEQEADPLTWKGRIDFACEIGPRYTQGRGVAEPIGLQPLEIVSLPEASGPAAMLLGALVVVVAASWARRRRRQ